MSQEHAPAAVANGGVGAVVGGAHSNGTAVDASQTSPALNITASLGSDDDDKRVAPGPILDAAISATVTPATIASASITATSEDQRDDLTKEDKENTIVDEQLMPITSDDKAFKSIETNAPAVASDNATAIAIANPAVTTTATTTGAAVAAPTSAPTAGHSLGPMTTETYSDTQAAAAAITGATADTLAKLRAAIDSIAFRRD